MKKRKLDRLQEIKNLYSRKKGVLYRLFATKYSTTKEIAEGHTTFEKSKVYDIRYSSASSFVNAGFILFVQVLLFLVADNSERKHPIFLVFQVLGSFSVGALLYRHFARTVALRMTQTGLEDLVGGGIYNWDNILATYIYSYYSGKTTSTYLTIEYYDELDDTFKSKDIDITHLEFGSKKIASCIEGFKRLQENSD